MPVLRHYRLPVVHYRDAVWPTLAQPDHLLPCYWNGLSHPDAVAHELIATLVAYGLTNAAAQAARAAAAGACPQPAAMPSAPFHPGLKLARWCASGPPGPGTAMDARAPESFTPLGTDRGWELREDARGKKGWIVEARTAGNSGNNSADVRGATIWFGVEFGKSPQLEVTFLRTYERIGQVQMHVGPPGMSGRSLHQALATYTLDGLHRDHFSVPCTAAFVSEKQAAERPGSQTLPSNISAGSYVVAFALANTTSFPKFKLLSLASC